MTDTEFTIVAVRPLRTRVEWAAFLGDHIEELSNMVIGLGSDLARARAELGSADFYEMVTQDLGRSRRWAQQLISIASNDALTDTKHVSRLPTDTASLYQLSRLDTVDVEYLFDNEIVSASTPRSMVTVAAKQVQAARAAGHELDLGFLKGEKTKRPPTLQSGPPKPYVPDDPAFVLMQALSNFLQAGHALANLEAGKDAVPALFQFADELLGNEGVDGAVQYVDDLDSGVAVAKKLAETLRLAVETVGRSAKHDG